MTGTEIAGAFGVGFIGVVLFRRLMARRKITINGPVAGDVVGRDKILRDKGAMQ